MINYYNFNNLMKQAMFRIPCLKRALGNTIILHDPVCEHCRNAVYYRLHSHTYLCFLTLSFSVRRQTPVWCGPVGMSCLLWALLSALMWWTCRPSSLPSSTTFKAASRMVWDADLIIISQYTHTHTHIQYILYKLRLRNMIFLKA